MSPSEQWLHQTVSRSLTSQRRPAAVCECVFFNLCVATSEYCAFSVCARMLIGNSDINNDTVYCSREWKQPKGTNIRTQFPQGLVLRHAFFTHDEVACIFPCTWRCQRAVQRAGLCVRVWECVLSSLTNVCCWLICWQRDSTYEPYSVLISALQSDRYNSFL